MKKKVMKEGKKREECIIGAAHKSSEHNAYSATQVSVPLIFAHIVDLYTFSLQFASMIWIENACDAQMHLRLQMHQPEELSRVEQLMKTTSWIKQNNNNKKTTTEKKNWKEKKEANYKDWKWLVETETEWSTTIKPWQNIKNTMHPVHKMICIFKYMQKMYAPNVKQQR